MKTESERANVAVKNGLATLGPEAFLVLTYYTPLVSLIFLPRKKLLFFRGCAPCCRPPVGRSSAVPDFSRKRAARDPLVARVMLIHPLLKTLFHTHVMILVEHS